MAGSLIWVESLIRDVSLREFSTGTFGLAVGVFCGWLLTQLKVEEVLFKLIEVKTGFDSPYMEGSVQDLITLGFPGVLYWRDGLRGFHAGASKR